MQQKVNSLLSTLDLSTYLDGLLFTSDTLCVIRYTPQEHPAETPPRQEDEEEEKGQSRREGEELLRERYYRLGTSGTTAPRPDGTTAPRPGGPTAPRQGGTTAPRLSGTTARPQAVLPLTPEAPQEASEKSSGKST